MTQGQSQNITSCVFNINEDNNDKTVSCSTMKLIKLEKNDEIYIEEMKHTTGYYAKTASYFGLIKIGD